jgi:hypothetical protein
MIKELENGKFLGEFMNKWPNLFIVGAPKAGTHSLYEYLNQHPKIFMSPRKEPYFFCPIMVPNEDEKSNPIRNEKEYLNLFKESKNEIFLGEATASYLGDPKSAELIYKKIPNAKIIIIVRNPIDRAFSSYWGLVKHGLKISFSDSIRNDFEKLKKEEISDSYLFAGFYFEQIKKYQNIFGKENVKIIISEEFRNNVEQVVNEVLIFLGLSKLDNFDKEIHGSYKIRKRQYLQPLLANKIITTIAKKILSKNSRGKIIDSIRPTRKRPEIKIEDREFLKKIYIDDVEKTEKLLNKDLNWFK